MTEWTSATEHGSIYLKGDTGSPRSIWKRPCGGYVLQNARGKQVGTYPTLEAAKVVYMLIRSVGR